MKVRMIFGTLVGGQDCAADSEPDLDDAVAVALIDAGRAERVGPTDAPAEPESVPARKPRKGK